jgi:hypothetical protein
METELEKEFEPRPEKEFMYQHGFLESMQLKGESNIKHHMVASMCGLSSVIGDVGSCLVA